MPIYAYRDHLPEIGERVFLAPDAHVAGQVTIGDDVSFWFATAARGDMQTITIGARTNVQDGAVLHVTHDTHPLVIGQAVVLGHSCVVHGCTIEDGALIGIGARVLDGAVVEAGAQIGAGAVVTPNTRIPSGHLALGIPARVSRELDEDEKAELVANAERYVRLKDEYRQELGDGVVRKGRSAGGES